MATHPPGKISQQEFFFNTSPDRPPLSTAPRPADLGRLPISVLGVSVRARKWLRAHRIADLDGLIVAEQEKIISRKCLDSQIRKELRTKLRRYWDGNKFHYLIALNFLDHGVEKALSRARIRKASVKSLKISPALLEIIQKRRIHTVEELLLQEELKWRNPRRLGNLLVNEMLIALCDYLNSVIPEPTQPSA